jgi:hypothetical protein
VEALARFFLDFSIRVVYPPMLFGDGGAKSFGWVGLGLAPRSETRENFVVGDC